MRSQSIPFSASTSEMDGRVYRERSYTGLVRIDEDGLVLEFREDVTEVAGPSLAQRREGIREVRITVSDIRSIDTSRGVLRRPVVDIELARLGPAEAVPWATGTRIRLTLPRKERARGRALGTDHRLLQADARLRELGEGDLTG